MTKPVKRIKAAAAAFAVAQNRDEVNRYIADIGRAQRVLTRVEADMGDEMARVKEYYEKQAEPHRQRVQALSAGVQTWCEANRAVLTADGKVKYHQFAAGEVNWRKRPPSCAISGMEKVIARLRNAKLERFIRGKEEANKEAILAEPEAVKGIAGIKIEGGEDFVIKPFETELEQVA